MKDDGSVGETAVQEDLVYDLGFFDGADTGYYLRLGYRVVAVEASPQLVAAGEQAFAAEIRDGRLTLVNEAVVEADGPATATLYVSEQGEWTSLFPAIAGRDGVAYSEVQVPTTTVERLLARFGTPYYLKIDLEGMDHAVLEGLAATRARPAFVSSEAESAGSEAIGDAQALGTLELLAALGYTRFKLVDQDSLRVLSPTDLHLGPRRNARTRLRSLVRRQGGERTHVVRVGGRRTTFPFGSSGPFGDDLAGTWLDEEESRRLLVAARSAYHRREDARAHGFWCDWHATRTS